MIFVELKCWILTFKVGYTFLQDTPYKCSHINFLKGKWVKQELCHAHFAETDHNEEED